MKLHVEQRVMTAVDLRVVFAVRRAGRSHGQPVDHQVIPRQNHGVRASLPAATRESPRPPD